MVEVDLENEHSPTSNDTKVKEINRKNENHAC